MFLSDEYVSSVVKEHPRPLNELGEFIFYRTYSRWLSDQGRREYWHETCRRAVEYNIGLAYRHLTKIGFTSNMEELQKEAEELFRSMYLTNQFLAGRTLWVGGADTGVAEKFPSSNFNCSFLNVDTWDSLCDMYYLLLVGAGVGFRCSLAMAEKLPKIKTDITCIHGDYNPVPRNSRLEHTVLNILSNGYAKIYIGDSKEGWVEALRYFLQLLTKKEFKDVHTVKFSYNSVRPKGERLKTFGGTASGHKALKDMLVAIEKVLKGQADTYLAPIEVDENGYGKLRPIHVLDIGCLLGYNVQVGGARRSSAIFLMDANDWECVLAKYGINGFHTKDQLNHHRRVGELLGEHKPAWFDSLSVLGKIRADGLLNHRRMSNNSIVFEKKPSRDFLHLLFILMQLEGEPGFINLQEARRRHPNAQGVNPCVEIILDNGEFCNLTTVNLTAFVKGKKLYAYSLYNAQKLSVRAAMRMTLVDLELANFDRNLKRDRLTGCSLTGVKDAFSGLELKGEDETFLLRSLRRTAEDEAAEYAKKLRIPVPLLVTCTKPEGTLSQVAGGVSPGVHYSHSPYYIRRIRVNSHDPLAQVALKLGWVVNPEVGTPGKTQEEKMKNASVWVIDFPIVSDTTKTKFDITAQEQLDTYFQFMEHYVNHNASVTVSVRKNEWAGVEERVWRDWDRFVGVSFISLDEHTYELAPYEAITKEQYEELKAKMRPFDVTMLHKIEQEHIETEIIDNECSSGACPVR